MTTKRIERVELQTQLIRCVWYLGDDECKNLAKYVGHAIRPAWNGARTDLVLFAVCDDHSYHRQGWESWLGEQGYESYVLVPWEALGTMLDELEASRMLEVV